MKKELPENVIAFDCAMAMLNRPNHAAGKPRTVQPSFHLQWRAETETLEDLVGLGIPGHLAQCLLTEIQTGHIRHVVFAAPLATVEPTIAPCHERA